MIPPRPQLICFFELLNDCFFHSWPSVPLICDWQWNNVSEVWGSNHWETLNHYCWFRAVQFRDGLCGSVRTLLYFGNSQKLKGCCDSKPSFKSTHLKVQEAYKIQLIQYLHHMISSSRSVCFVTLVCCSKLELTGNLPQPWLFTAWTKWPTCPSTGLSSL